ncbi:Serine/threonine-protein kinase PknD [subsurface metagenome]
MKLGLPTGAEADKAAAPSDRSDVPTSGTPPGRFVPPEPAELAKQFPQLEILELLGQGGMGAVYKARQKQLDRLVALKILPPEVGQDPAFAERFTREARSMAMLNHPRIVSVYDFGQTEQGLYYFIMEFVNGTDLRQVIQTGELSPSEALAIVPQICEALQYAHEEGIVHRDIKPENILMDKKGRVKIADFGLAKLLDRPASLYTLTGAGQRMGTPHYMAPEQIEHPGQVDHRADIYSLGVVFYEMLTGELPLGRFAPPSQKVQVDVRLDEIVLHTLEKEPERRYQHASEVKTDVETIKADSGGPKAPIAGAGQVPTPAPAINRMEKHITIVAVLSLVFGTLGTLLGIFLFVVIAGGGLISGDPEAKSITGIVGVSLALFFFITSAPKLITGIGLLKRRSWARILALILAIPDLMNIPIGTAIGIYVIWVLLNNETAQLFAHTSAGRKKQQAAQTKPNRRGLLIGLVVAGIAIVMMALLTLPILLPALFMVTFRRVSGPQYETAVSAPGIRYFPPNFPYGDEGDLTFGPEGLTLNDTCVLKLNLKPSEAMEVNRILQTAYDRYPELEAQYTQQLRAGNSLKVTISPFREEAESFLEQLWVELDSTLDEEQRVLARKHLPLGLIFGKNQFGQARVIFMITKENGMFSYTTTCERPDGRTESGGGRNKTLRPGLQRFWEQSATDK